MVYFGSEDSNVYALDGQSGEEVWRYKTGGWVTTTLTVDAADSIVYAAAEDGKLYALQYK